MFEYAVTYRIYSPNGEYPMDHNIVVPCQEELILEDPKVFELLSDKLSEDEKIIPQLSPNVRYRARVTGVELVPIGS